MAAGKIVILDPPPPQILHPISGSHNQAQTEKTMSADTAHHDQTRTIASTLLFGLVGAGLVYYARRSRPGILPTVAATAGYSLITKAVSGVVMATLGPSKA